MTFQRRLQDTDGISVFQVTNDTDRNNVVAAIACQRGNTNPVDFIEIPEQMLAEYGVATPTDGCTPLVAANALHRSLDWSNDKLEQLADRLLDEGVPPRRYSRLDVRAAIRALDLNSVEGERPREFVRVEQEKAKAPR